MSMGEKKGMGPVSTILVSVITAMLIGGGVPWWWQMWRDQPRLPEGAGSWYGTILRTQQTLETWPVGLSRNVAGPLAKGDTVIIYFDGKTPTKKGRFRADDVSAGDAAFVAEQVVDITKPLPEGDAQPGYSMLLVGDLDGTCQLKLFEGSGFESPYSDLWTPISRTAAPAFKWP
jgi:hypothetical protein